jgi:hypothetical protein
MTKSCHGFKAASQQNRFCARFFLRHHRGRLKSGCHPAARPACITSSAPFPSIAGDEINPAIADGRGAAIILFRGLRNAAVRGHA